MRFTNVVWSSAIAVALAAAVGGTAGAAPYFQISLDDVTAQQETQSFAGTQIIPNGARGFDNIFDNELTITLVDPDAPEGTSYPIRIDYVGSDAAFTNTFTAGGGAVSWCNDAASCPAGSEPLGAGNQDWFGNYARTAVIQVTVGQVIPFQFTADVLDEGGNGSHVVRNGRTTEGAHMGAFFIRNGSFDFSSFDTTGEVLAVGLTDGFVTGSNDDDHQDFMVRLSIVPEPGTLVLFGLGLAGLAGAGRRRG